MTQKNKKIIILIKLAHQKKIAAIASQQIIMVQTNPQINLDLWDNAIGMSKTSNIHR